MKSFLMIFTLCFFSSTLFLQAQNSDQIAGSEPTVTPGHIQTLLEEIKTAEDNEDWQSYYLLREQIIQEFQLTNPELASCYNTASNNTLLYTNRDDDPTNSEVKQSGTNLEMREKTSSDVPEWANDVVFYENRFLTDFSMDVSFDDVIYVSVATNNGTSDDSLFIFKSIDGGLTWNLWVTRYSPGGDYDKTEVMCFDGAGEDYVLLFYVYTVGGINQRLNAARYLMSDSSSLPTVSTIVTGGVVDFAADRNWPASDYRAVVLYDSSSSIRSVRSEPSSYGTVWQDYHAIGHVGRDIDLCYGYLGSVYITYNGFNSGNLYVRENLNYGDPASWSSATTLETGATDTTMHAEIIASRENQTDINVQVLYTKKFGDTYNLRRANKDGGAGAWTADIPFITNPTWDIKLPSLYCSKINLYTVFQNSYSMSQLNNVPPRQINQRVFDGSTWLGSQTISDYLPTGLQKSYVAELNGEPIVLYTGNAGQSLYFDNKVWVPTSVTVTAPNGGETWGVSTMQNITWTSSGVTNVKIELSTDNGSSWSDIIASTPSSGTYNWTVSNTPSTQCLVRISDVSNPSTLDESDAVFTIEVVPGVEDDLSGIPDSYQLLQNFPNPFNPTTTIYYGLPQESSVELIIFDVLGNEVLKISEDQKPAGYHKFDFDASRLNSGVYFYRINSGDYVKTMKMVLMK